MKFRWTLAAAFFLVQSLPVLAQGWGGTGLIAPSRNAVPSAQNPAAPRCITVGGQSLGGTPCPSGSTLFNDSSGVTFVGPITNLPAGVDYTNSGLGVNVSGVVESNQCPSGYCNLIATLPLTSFANAASMSAQIGAINSQLAATNGQVSLVSLDGWMAAAMAASLAPTSPLEGRTNRVGLNMATMGGQSALAVGYSHIHDDFDVNAGLSFGASRSGYVAGRVGLGFSW